jgi:hypothetical protein
MGLFDIFKKNKSDAGAVSAGDKRSAASKWAAAAGDERAQSYERQEAIAELCKLKTPDAVEALLKRFTFQTDPSITDQEEKEAAFEGIVATGRDALEPVRAFVAKAKSLAWPVRIASEVLSEEEFVEELLAWLSRWDTEYAKFIDPKLQLLAALEEHKHPKIRAAVEAFLQDVNEPARFHAVATTLAQGDDASVGPLVAVLVDEESVRVRTRLLDGFAALGWTITEKQREAARRALPYQFTLDDAGKVHRR